MRHENFHAVVQGSGAVGAPTFDDMYVLIGELTFDLCETRLQALLVGVALRTVGVAFHRPHIPATLLLADRGGSGHRSREASRDGGDWLNSTLVGGPTRENSRGATRQSAEHRANVTGQPDH